MEPTFSLTTKRPVWLKLIKQVYFGEPFYHQTSVDLSLTLFFLYPTLSFRKIQLTLYLPRIESFYVSPVLNRITL